MVNKPKPINKPRELITMSLVRYRGPCLLLSTFWSLWGLFHIHCPGLLVVLSRYKSLMEVYVIFLGCLLTSYLLLCLASGFEKFLEGKPGRVTDLLLCPFILIELIDPSSMHGKISMLCLSSAPAAPLPQQSPASLPLTCPQTQQLSQGLM